MKSHSHILLSTVLLAALILACGGSAPALSTEDTVNTAVAGTHQAEALAQATVNAAALTAMPATPTPGPAVEYVTLTEEELTALIDEAVSEAVTATEVATTAVTTVTSDDVVTAEEVAYLYGYYDYADYYIQSAEQLLEEYYDLYSTLAYEMIVELGAIETALAQMNDTLLQVSASLEQINAALQQGAAAAQEAIAQLESAAQTAQADAQVVREEAQDIREVLEADRQGRLIEISQMQAEAIPTDRLSALQSAFEFIDFARTSMGDDRLSRDELFSLAQMGLNAQAGLQQYGAAGAGPLANGPDLTQFSGRFGELTAQFARGEIPHARAGIDQFELSLGQRPGLRP